MELVKLKEENQRFRNLNKKLFFENEEAKKRRVNEENKRRIEEPKK